MILIFFDCWQNAYKVCPNNMEINYFDFESNPMYHFFTIFAGPFCANISETLPIRLFSPTCRIITQ